MEKILRNKKAAVCLTVFAMFLWGSAIPLIKSTYLAFSVASGDAGAKILIAGLRFFIAFIISTFYYLVTKKDKFYVHSKSFVILLSLLQVVLQYIFYYIGLSHTSGIKSSLIQSTNVFILIFISFFMMNEDKITKRIIAALLFGFLGVLISNYGKNSDFSFSFVGEGFIFLSTCTGAFSSVLVRKYGRKENPFLLNSLTLLLGSLILICIGVVFSRSPLKHTVETSLMLLYGGFITASAFSIWNAVLKHYSVTEFSQYKAFIPIFGSILSIIVLKERLSFSLFIALALIISGSIILNK